ncbi:unnamed protein product [Trichobilharzia szidati]|nr:unnamed protein product [Trichobilharzia szidati]
MVVTNSKWTDIHMLGVRVGSIKSLPFGIINNGITRALVEISLDKYNEFQILDNNKSLTTDECMDEHINMNEMVASTKSQLSSSSQFNKSEKQSVVGITNLNSHNYLEYDKTSEVYRIFISPKAKWIGSIIYKPKVVSLHDFTLPLIINKLSPKLLSQKFEEANNSNEEQLVNEDQSNSKLTAKEFEPRVLATGLRQPITTEPKNGALKFTTTLGDTPSESGNVLYQHLSIKSIINLPMKWHLAVHEIQRFNKRGYGKLTIRDINGTELLPDLDGYINGDFMDCNDKNVQLEIQLCPIQAGCFKLNLPLWLTFLESFECEQSPKSNHTHYQTLQIIIELKKMEIKFEPERILLPPVPTGVNVRVPVSLTSYQLNKPTKITGFWNFLPACEVQSPICEANIQCPFTVEYPEGQIMKPDNALSTCNTGSLNLLLIFNSKINGLVLAPNPRPLCLIIIASNVNSDVDGTSYSSKRNPLSSYICSAALPVSAAVDNSLISWFDYVTRRPSEFRLNYPQNPAVIVSKLKKIKYSQNFNILALYHLFDELKLTQKEYLDTEDTFSDQSSNVDNNMQQKFDQKSMCGLGYSYLNCKTYNISNSPFLLETHSDNLNDTDHRRPSPSTVGTTMTNIYGSSTFLPDWQLIDHAATEYLQRWLSVHGFPNGHHSLKFPEDFRNCISLSATVADLSVMGEKQKSYIKSQSNTMIGESSRSLKLKDNNYNNSNSHGNDKTSNEFVSRSLNPLYNCLQHLCGDKQPPGLLPTINLSINNPYEALSTVYFYCSALLTFARSQGSCLPHVLPEHLMEPNDYHLWHKYGCPGLTESARILHVSLSQNFNATPTTYSESNQTAETVNKQNGRHEDSLKINLCPLKESSVEQFLIISERAWTDLMLQIIKCLLFNRIDINSLDSAYLPPKELLKNKSNEASPSAISSSTSPMSYSQPNEPNYETNQILEHAVNSLEKTDHRQISKLTNSTDLQVDSCYSSCERILLTWLNYCYHQYACQIWPDKKSIFMDRLIVTNFDNDLRDGIVLASTIGAYIPSLIPNFLSKIYTQPTSKEKCFHNAIILVQALRTIRFEYDLYPSDITSPHPFAMSLLCLHLFCQLPDYLPKQTIHFTGLLNSSAKRQLVITNTSSHTLTYSCIIIGPNATDFNCTSSGNLNKSTKRENNKVKKCQNSINDSITNINNNSNNGQVYNNMKEMKITVPSKGKVQLSLEYKSRFLKPTEAIFLAVSQRQNGCHGKNLSFILSGTVGGLEALQAKVVRSPCYQMTEFKLPVINPYKTGGIFQITVIESRTDLFNTICQVRGLTTSKKESNSRNILTSESYSVTERSSFDESSDNSQLPPEIMKEYYQRTQYQSFHCREFSIELHGNANNSSTNLHTTKISNDVDSKQQQLQMFESCRQSIDELSIVYLPLGWGTRECCLLLSNEMIGEFVVLLKGIAQLPQPSVLPFSDSFDGVNNQKSVKQNERGYRIKSAVAAASFGRSGDPNVIYLRCPIGCEIKETLWLPVKNESRRMALLSAIRIRLSPAEVKRRELANTLESDELLELANKELTLLNCEENSFGKNSKSQKRLHVSRHLMYSVEVDSSMIRVPSKIQVPTQLDSDSDSTFPLTLQIKAEKPGLTSAKLVLQGPDDIRLYRIECVALPDNEKIVLTFTSPLNHPITQPLPIVNRTAYDWELIAKFTGYPVWFTGPSTVSIPSNTTMQYPITYLPRREAESHTKLVLQNITDGSQLEYHLNGNVLKPMSLGKINLEFTINACDISDGICKITKQTHLQTFTVKVPNSTSVKQSFQLQTNLPKGLIEWIPNSQKSKMNRIEVMSGRTDDCKFQVCASKRGCYQGVLVFLADNQTNNPDSDDDNENNDEQMSTNRTSMNHFNETSHKLNDTEETGNQVYRIWYEIEINIKAGPPIKQVEIVCPCLSCKTIELPFTIQSDWFTDGRVVEFDVVLDDKCLSGPKTHSLQPENNSAVISSVYMLEYTPSIVGVSSAAVIFHNNDCGEFWIELLLKAVKPEIVNVPIIEAELGSSKITKIVLNNPTDEMYILKPKITNTDVFKLQLATSAKQLANITSPYLLETDIIKMTHVYRCQQYANIQMMTYYTLVKI